MHASIDSLPLDTLVQILCKLNHDELQPLITVSKSFRIAVHAAQKSYFDFTTPAPTKTLAFSLEMEVSPKAQLMRSEFKKPRKFNMLSEEETRRITIVLFPA
ncbi:F-box domain-containing protein [Dioscorea alata]|uniref:F-box domain-containing protein n=1 Tax=Dioscorea alata TaxID=55571 RepID=A0ACB7WV53_DIOAL|nr:F-box domain-containing protein [Dioscorea alata]